MTIGSVVMSLLLFTKLVICVFFFFLVKCKFRLGGELDWPDKTKYDKMRRIRESKVCVCVCVCTHRGRL